jgi:predicted porin
MKKTLVAIAALTAIAASAQTTTGKPGVEIQGNFNGGYQANSYNGVSVKGIDQNGAGTTQINIRGLEDLGGGMSAYFRVENDLSIMNNATNQGVLPAYSASSAVALTPGANSTLQKTTTGATSTWGNGELAVGLRSPMGDLSFGALNNAGLVYGQLTAAPTQGTSFAGGYGTVLGADPTLTVVRWANSFRYITPNVNGFEASFIYAAKQNSASVPVSATSGVAVTTTSLGLGLNNQVGAKELGLKYAQGPFKVAYVASQTSIDSFCAAPSSSALTNLSGTAGTANNPCFSATTLATGSAILTNQDNKQSGLFGSYDLGNGFLVTGATQKTTLGQIGNLTTGNQSDRTATFLNAQYTTGKHTVFASNGSVKENATANKYNGNTSKFMGVGYNYALSKMTSLVARYEKFDDQARILPLTGTTAYTSTQGASTTDLNRVRSMIGINHNF